MTRRPSKIALPILAIATLVALPAATPASSSAAPGSRTPKVKVLCLPPGGSKPVACSSAMAGETILLVSLDGGALPSNITLAPRQAARKPVIGRATISPKSLPGSPASYRFTLPLDWCEGQSAAGENVQGSQDIVITGSSIPAKSSRDADSLGYFQMRC